MRATTPEEYWNEVARISLRSDNVAKKQVILSKILRHELINCRVLEIGCGHGLIAAAINVVLMGHWKYTGTDISQTFCDEATKNYALNTIKTDIKNLPNGDYSYVFLFDVLEHVPKADMEAGFYELSRILNGYGSIFINNPSQKNICLHDKRFDFSFTLDELETLCEITNTEITCFEPYAINHIKLVNKQRKTQLCKYTWIELSR